MRRALTCFALLAACSGDPSPPPTPDVPAVDAPDGAAPADVTAPRDASPDASASCGASFGAACNVATGGGCAAGQGCYLAEGVTGLRAQCRTAGRAGWGERCAAATDCREGFLCLGNPGTCQKICCPDDNDSCRDEARGGRAGARCALTINNLPSLRACVADSGCDPFAASNNRCPAETPRCNPTGDGATCAGFAAGCTPGGDGAPCCNTGCCRPGHLCVITGSDGGACDPARPNGVCRRACNAMTAMPDAQCPTGQRCSVTFSPESRLPSYFRACAL